MPQLSHMLKNSTQYFYFAWKLIKPCSVFIIQLNLQNYDYTSTKNIKK